jgi:hypothetical protein
MKSAGLNRFGGGGKEATDEADGEVFRRTDPPSPPAYRRFGVRLGGWPPYHPGRLERPQLDQISQ